MDAPKCNYSSAMLEAWNGMGCRSTLWYGMVWYGMGCRSTQWFGMVWGAGAHNGSGCRSTQWFGMDGAGAQVDRVYHSAGTVAHELLD